MAGLYLYIELAKGFGGTPDEVLHIADKLADQVGNASGGIGDMLAAFEDGNPEFGITLPCLRGGAHTSAVAPDHYQSLMRHADPPPCRAKRSTWRECLSIIEQMCYNHPVRGVVGPIFFLWSVMVARWPGTTV
jgi:hypothetical protein